MSNLSLGSTYSNARASLVTATGKGGKGSGGGLSGDVNITLPNIAVDVDWNLTKNQGATLAIKNKPTIATGDFYQSTNNPFTKLNGIPTGAKIGYVEAGTLDCDGRLAANNISTNLVDTDKLQATDVASITDPDGQPLFATVAATGQYTDLLSKPALSTVATTGKYTDLSSKPTLSTVAATGNYTDLLSKPTFSTVATSGNYTDLSNAPPQLGDVELQLQNFVTDVDWNLTSNQGATLAIKNKPNLGNITSNLATVASTGSYYDLIDKPRISEITNRPFITAYTFTVATTGTGFQGLSNTGVNVPSLNVLAPGFTIGPPSYDLNFYTAPSVYGNRYGVGFIRLAYIEAVWSMNVTASSSTGVTSVGILPLGNQAYDDTYAMYGANTLTSGTFGGNNMLGLTTLASPAPVLTTQYTGPWHKADDFSIAVSAPAGTVNIRLVLSCGVKFG
jgi:hypothetical protein